MPDPTATPPAPPLPTITHLDKDLADTLGSLAHRHAHISFLLIGVIVVILGIGGVFAYYSNKSYEAAMARAEKAEQVMLQYKDQSDKQIKDFQDKLTANDAARAADAQKILDLENQIRSQNAATQAAMDKALKPGKSAQEAFSDLSGAYKGVIQPSLNLSKDPSGEQLLGFRVPEVQRFTADKLDLDNKTRVLGQQQTELVTKDNTIKTLNGDLTNSKNALAALQKTEDKCEDTVKAYKTVAKKTRWQKIWGGMKKGIAIGGALALGYEIGHKL